ncbi:MAG: Flp pilus assembly complex ATPase component TadA, partial [Gemmatimonadota bacterium]|nr:Flp pilus assembly complex ATPase component TadA [Gemmatimonadota bacterium]
ILQHLNHPAANIITVEDPVEREIPGITQVPVRPSPDAELDLSYAAVLRAMLRQDPNILMVGEIRDPETARIAVRAAITGHLVLSTVHTNDAPGTMTRLLDMGIEPYNIIGALRLVVAQRLVRRICPHCREPEEPSDEQLAMAETRRPQVAGIRFFRGRGCAHCNHTGYRGRIGLFEVMQITDRIRPLILSRKTEAEIRAAALSGQMIPLRSVGWARIREGKTTLEEVLRET